MSVKGRDLPEGWTTARLPDLISQQGILTDGDWVETEDQDPNGEVRLTQLADVGDGVFRNRSKRFMTSAKAAELRCTFLEPDDVLVARMPDPLGRACNFPGDPRPSVSVVDGCIVRPATEYLSSRWLMNFINAPDFRSEIARFQSGSTRKRISKANLCTIALPVPPLPEQQRIVEAIESYFTRLDDAVATLERVQRNLKRYRNSVLKAAVEGRLVPTEAELARAEGRDYEPASVLLERILAERRRRWQDANGRGRYEEPGAPGTSELPELPEGWCYASLPQLGELNRGKSKHRPRNDPRLLGGPYPFIQTGDVRNADGIITSYEATYSEFGLAQSKLWPAGTLCITIAANIAETGILRFDACFPDSVVGLLQDDPLITRYVEFFIRTARDKLAQYAPATAQKNINLQTLSEIAVPLPPAAEQARIVAEVDRQFSVARYCHEAALNGTARCARLCQSVLKWAFEGKLADQDPSDEPASALLERIRSQTLARRPSAGDTEGRRLRRASARRPARAENMP